MGHNTLSKTDHAEAMEALRVRPVEKLLKWQETVKRAQKHGARFILLKAGRKTGKTEFMRHDIWEHAQKPPLVDGQINAYIAPTRTQAKAILWRRLKAHIPREVIVHRPRESDLSFDLTNGLRLQLWGAEHEDAIRGLTFGRAHLDEADFMRGGFFDEIVGPNLSVTQGGGVMSSTPNGKWFTKLWRGVKDGRMGRNWVAFHFTIYDNPFISRREIEDIKSKVSNDIWEREYMANENAMSGLQYSEFDNKAHVVEHREPQRDSMIVRSLDWGWDHPSHCLWAELYFDKELGKWGIYIFREYAAYGKNVHELTLPILGVDSFRNYIFNIIDESARRTEMGTGQSILREFGKAGLVCRTPFGVDDYRINAAKMLLRQGLVKISANCRTLIKQLQDVEWGQTYGDDAADAFKYLCSWVYDRDFAHILADSGYGMRESREPIDPTGLLAPRHSWAAEPDHISWELPN